MEGHTQGIHGTPFFPMGGWVRFERADGRAGARVWVDLAEKADSSFYAGCKYSPHPTPVPQQSRLAGGTGFGMTP